MERGQGPAPWFRSVVPIESLSPRKKRRLYIKTIRSSKGKRVSSFGCEEIMSSYPPTWVAIDDISHA